MNGLLGGIRSVTLSDAEAEKRKCTKSVLERQYAPVFDIAIELTSRHSWLIYNNVADAVDKMLISKHSMAYKQLKFDVERREMCMDETTGLAQFMRVRMEEPEH